MLPEAVAVSMLPEAVAIHKTCGSVNLVCGNESCHYMLLFNLMLR